MLRGLVDEGYYSPLNDVYRDTTRPITKRPSNKLSNSEKDLVYERGRTETDGTTVAYM